MKTLSNFNKKGQFKNYFTVLALIIVFAIIGMFTIVMWTQYTNTTNTVELYNSSAPQKAIYQFTKSFRTYDNIMVIFIVGLILGIGITSYKLATAPIFFIITIIMAPIFGLISYFFNYVFLQIISVDIVYAATVYFPRTIIFCTNFHWIGLALLVVGSLTLYGKRQPNAI